MTNSPTPIRVQVRVKWPTQCTLVSLHDTSMRCSLHKARPAASPTLLAESHSAVLMKLPPFIAMAGILPRGLMVGNILDRTWIGYFGLESGLELNLELNQSLRLRLESDLGFELGSRDMVRDYVV